MVDAIASKLLTVYVLAGGYGPAAAKLISIVPAAAIVVNMISPTKRTSYRKVAYAATS
jgi:hypothetical protein